MKFACFPLVLQGTKKINDKTFSFSLLLALVTLNKVKKDIKLQNAKLRNSPNHYKKSVFNINSTLLYFDLFVPLLRDFIAKIYESGNFRNFHITFHKQHNVSRFVCLCEFFGNYDTQHTTHNTQQKRQINK